MHFHDRSPLPEELFQNVTEPPLALTLRCTGCRKRFSREFGWACLSAEHARDEEEDWDGVLLSDLVECPKCGAVDEYEIAPMSYLELTASVLRASADGGGSGRVIFGVSQLWDGSIVRRPSQALERLRELTRENPESAEAFRRLGNSCERWGLADEALSSWRKACELDEGEAEAAYSLADSLLGSPDHVVEGFAYLRRAVSALPHAARTRGLAPAVVRGVAGLLEDVAAHTRDPLALIAGWSEGERQGDPVVTMSVVDLAKVGSFERLAELVSSGHFLELALTPELPDEEPTILQQLLSADDPSHARPGEPDGSFSRLTLRRQEPVRAGARVGRNDPCPCGSGRKHKRCCGRGRS